MIKKPAEYPQLILNNDIDQMNWVKPTESFNNSDKVGWTRPPQAFGVLSYCRNVKYFGDTQMVFSDTGTAGLNVRVLLDNQIFIASGPGIRVVEGNEYAHLAFLNSRIAAYYVRMMSPKLTIAAGYIGQIPVNDNIYSSVVLEKEARL